MKLLEGYTHAVSAVIEDEGAGLSLISHLKEALDASEHELKFHFKR
jgi:hypothetical protein